MKIKFTLLLVIIFLTSGVSSKEVQHVLFIGNSFTYRNHLPKMFGELAKSNGKQVDVQWNVRGKTSFYQHIGRPELFKAIQWKKWDIVVLQGSSRDFLKGDAYLQKRTLPALRTMIHAIRERNPDVKIVFYMTWAYKNGYKPIARANTFIKMTNLVAKEYLEVAKLFDASVAPVGLFWKNLKAKNPKIKLHQPDRGHPSKLGSFATACCMYCTFYEEPVHKIPLNQSNIKYANYIRKSANNFVLSNHWKTEDLSSKNK
jgi:hypothetical protein